MYSCIIRIRDEMIVKPTPRWQIEAAREAAGAVPRAAPLGHLSTAAQSPSSTLRVVLLIAGVLLYSFNSLLLVLSKGENGSHFTFHLSSVILLSELLRGILALIFVAASGSCAQLCDIFSPRLVLFAIPAAIYAIEDEISFLCAEYMDSGTFQHSAPSKF